MKLVWQLTGLGLPGNVKNKGSNRERNPLHGRRAESLPKGEHQWQSLLVSWAAISNYHKLSGWKQWKLIISQVWRPEIWDQGEGRVAPSWRPWERFFSKPFSRLLGAVGKLSPFWACCSLFFFWGQMLRFGICLNPGYSHLEILTFTKTPFFK